MSAFRDLGLSEEILQALDELGYSDPTPIQEQAIPELLAGHDVIGQAQTGTGKTAAFGLPMLQYLDPGSERDPGAGPDPDPRALHPGDPGASRLRRAPRRRGDRGVRRPGGEDPAVAASRVGAHVVVATVGRTLDLISRGSLDLDIGPLRGPRRGGRDARSGLHRGRRADPPDLPGGPPDLAVLGHDPAPDRAAGRPLHVRPDDDQGDAEAAHRGRDRAGLRRGAARARRSTA